MRIIEKACALGAILSLLLLCSCASSPRSLSIARATQFPADVTMNPDAGCQNYLHVTLRLANGKELPFIVDTGASVTCFDKSLEPELGKRLGTGAARHPGGPTGIYAAPKLYLGNTPLMNGPRVITYDFHNPTVGRPPAGILGMDCLKHYCIQLDFEAGKMRFLDPVKMNTAELGKAVSFVYNKSGRPFLQGDGLVKGTDGRTLIDSGFQFDCGLAPEQFARELREEKMESIPGGARISKCVWNGETYTNLNITKSWNALGLSFLARHLVTFDFLGRTMYLKQTRVGPYISEDLETGSKFIESLREKSQLPGWTKDEKGVLLFPGEYSGPVTFAFRKNADSFTYHYTIFRGASKENPWELQRAWQTDQNDRTVQELPVP